MSSSSFSSTSAKKLKIGIIGFGPFAHFLAKTMIKQGHSLSATSRSDYSQLSRSMGISFFRDMESFIQLEQDVVLISTSILSLSEVVNSIPFSCLKRPTLFADVLSVKEHPRDILLKAVPEESDVLCTHPMFGPESGKDGWKDLTFVYDRVRIRDETISSAFLHIFQSEVVTICTPSNTWFYFMFHSPDDKRGCKMLEMSCEEHDKLAARSQFLTHTIGRILSEMEIESTSIDTKGFQKLVELKESTMKDSFDLFSGLFVHNRFAHQQMENLEHAFANVKQKLVSKKNGELDPHVTKN